MSRKLARISLPVIFGLGYYMLLRPRLLTLGAHPDEVQNHLPGDEIIPITNFQMTRAININAPAETVWPWIAQLGRDRTGFYGLDNLLNHGIPSAAYLRQDLPAPQPEMAMDGSYRVLQVEPNRLLLYGAFNLPTIAGQPMERTTLLLLMRQPDDRTRLLIRTRGYALGRLGPLYLLAYELIDYWLTSAQMHNIQQRAEILAQLRTPVQTSIES